MAKTKEQFEATQTIESRISILRESVVEIESKMDFLLNKVKDKDAIIFIGKTGAGKSTTISYLAKMQLELKIDGRNKILEHVYPENAKQMKIGHNLGKSETELPNYVITDKHVLWDCPGFGDTKGSDRDILNAYCIKKVFDTAKNLRIVLVASRSSINDARASGAIDVLNALGELLAPDMIRAKSALSLIITKNIDDPDPEIPPLSSSDIIRELTQVLDANITTTDAKITRNALEFIKALQENKLVYLLNQPKKGLVEFNQVDNIMSVITEAKPILDCRVNISISPDSKVDVFKYYNLMNKTIEDLYEKFLTDVKVDFEKANSADKAFLEQAKKGISGALEIIRAIDFTNKPYKVVLEMITGALNAAFKGKEFDMSPLKRLENYSDFLKFISTLIEDKEEIKLTLTDQYALKFHKAVGDNLETIESQLNVKLGILTQKEAEESLRLAHEKNAEMIKNATDTKMAGLDKVLESIVQMQKEYRDDMSSMVNKLAKQADQLLALQKEKGGDKKYEAEIVRLNNEAAEKKAIREFNQQKELNEIADKKKVAMNETNDKKAKLKNEEARKHYNKGEELFKLSKWNDAYDNFKLAYEITQDAASKTLYKQKANDCRGFFRATNRDEIKYVIDIEYDNPILNDKVFVENIVAKYGIKGIDKLITLTEDISTSDINLLISDNSELLDYLLGNVNCGFDEVI